MSLFFFIRHAEGGILLFPSNFDPPASGKVKVKADKKSKMPLLIGMEVSKWEYSHWIYVGLYLLLSGTFFTIHNRG